MHMSSTSTSGSTSSASEGPSPFAAKTVPFTPVERQWPHRQFSILGDVLGPDGHGPSSSHTIAPQRVAYEAYGLLGGIPDDAQVFLFNSFATTGKGHRTDVAITAGLLGFPPIDGRTRDALRLAVPAGLMIYWHSLSDPEEHPNTLVLKLSRENTYLEMKAVSIGGGNYNVLFCRQLPLAA